MPRICVIIDTKTRYEVMVAPFDRWYRMSGSMPLAVALDLQQQIEYVRGFPARVQIQI